MKSKREKGCRILYERQERTSIEKGQRVYIKNTQTEVRELFRRTADNLGAERTSPISNTESKKALARQKVCELNQRINHEIDQLKLLRHNIRQKPIVSEGSESDMKMNDNKAAARLSLVRDQFSDSHDRRLSDTENSQEDTNFMSFRTVAMRKNETKRVEGGCNYIPRQKDKNYDQDARTVYQCDFGNPSRCIACFPVPAQHQFHNDDNCVCCTLRPSVPIPVLTHPNCQYQPSWACVSSLPYNPRTATDLNTEDFCRNWCACNLLDSTLRGKKKGHRASEETSGSKSKSRSSSKASRLLDENMRKKVKKSRVTIDSASLDQYKVQSHEKLLKVTMRKESKSAPQRGSKLQSGDGKSKAGEKFADKKTDEEKDSKFGLKSQAAAEKYKTGDRDKKMDEDKNSMYRDYMDKYKKENDHTENEVGAASRAQDHAQIDGTGQAGVHLGGTRKSSDDEYADGSATGYCDTNPICAEKKRAGKGRAICHTKKCACVAKELQTNQEYTDQRHAQDLAQVEGGEQRSGQKIVRPEGNRKPVESANSDRYGPGFGEKDPVSRPDKRVERYKDVCDKKKCVCVAQEAQTDDESIKKETRLTQTDLQLREERRTQTDIKESQQERPTQTDMDGRRHERLTQTDLQASRHEGLTQTDPELSHQISNAISPISGATVKKSSYDFEDVKTSSQKENPLADQKKIQGQYSPPTSSRKSYSAQSPSSQKYMKFISRDSLTEEAQQDEDTECSRNCPCQRFRQCDCKPVSPGPSQGERENAFQDFKKEQYLIDDENSPVVRQVSSHHDLDLGPAGLLEKSSPFCAPLTSADKCDPHPMGCYCDVNQNVDKSNTSGSNANTVRSMASSSVKSQKRVPDSIEQHQPYESTYQQSYASSADPEYGRRNVDMSSYDEDNGQSTEPSFPDQSHTGFACATDCTGRKLSGRNLSFDSYQEPQTMFSRLGYNQYFDAREINLPEHSLVPRQSGLSQFASTFPCARANNDECKKGLPIMVCEKRTRSVTFEDEGGKVRRMRNIVERCRRSIDWEQVLTRCSVEQDQDRDGNNTSQSVAAFVGNDCTDDDDCTCTCRSSSSAGTEMTCIESNYDLHDDFSNNAYESNAPPNYGSLPQFNHCPCMLRTYVSLASICTTDSQSNQ